MHNQPCQRAGQADDKSPCSCVPALRGTLAGTGSAVARAFLRSGTVFRFESVSKYESVRRQAGSEAIRAGRPVPSSTQVTYRMTRRILGRMQSDECGALWTQFKASSPVRAQMTPANGLHGLNPRNTGHRDPRCSVQPFRQGLRNLSGQSGGKDLFGNEWLPQGTLGFGWERVGCLSTLAWTMENHK